MDNEQFVFIKNKDDDNMLVYWLETNELRTIPKPKFFDGQFVQTSEKHQSNPKEFCQLFTPVFADKLVCWRYGIRYMHRDGRGCGSSFYWGEEEFLPLSNSLDILIAERLTLESEIKDLSIHIKRSEDKLEKIIFGIDLINKQLGQGERKGYER